MRFLVLAVALAACAAGCAGDRAAAPASRLTLGGETADLPPVIAARVDLRPGLRALVLHVDGDPTLHAVLLETPDGQFRYRRPEGFQGEGDSYVQWGERRLQARDLVVIAQEEPRFRLEGTLLEGDREVPVEGDLVARTRRR